MSNIRTKITISSYDDLNNPYYGGGGATAVHEIAKRLTAKYDVKVISGKYPGYKNRTIDGVEYFHTGLRFFGGKISQLMYQLSLPFYFIHESFDLWIESFTPPFSVSILPLLTDKPVIGLCHMLSGLDMQRKYKLPFTLIENIGLKYYRHIITPSDFYAKKIMNINPKADVISIPNGVYLPLKTNDNKLTKEKYISFLGRIEFNQKGLDLLLQAYKNIFDKTNIKLHIAGSGEKSELKKLNSFITDLNLTDSVILHGKLKGIEKDSFIRNSLIMVVPSRYETFSLTALEALSYGIPLITFDIDGFDWLTKKCAIKIPCFNIESLSASLLSLIKNDHLRYGYSQEAIKFVKNYTWEKSAEKYATYIDHIFDKFSYE